MGLFDKNKKKKEVETESEIILESWSPVCDIQAFVEKSATCYYLYLWVNPSGQSPEMKSCWICNRSKAPEKPDFASMENGVAPMNPKQYVSHDEKGMELDEKALSFVWFEEGDAVALLSKDEVICVVPCWSGYNGFCGYSEFAKGTGPFAWELEQAKETFTARVRRSKKFWEYFEGEYWREVQKGHLDVLERFFGPHERYFAIDGGKFPPKALVLGTRDSKAYAVSLGVSMIPMPKVEMSYQEESSKYRRTEFGFAAVEEHGKLCEMMGGMISAIAAIPWGETTFFGHGHTLPWRNVRGFEAILFLNPKEVPELEKPEYDTFMGEDINLLWLVLITKEEYEYVQENDVTALVEKAEERSMLHVFNGKGKFLKTMM